MVIDGNDARDWVYLGGADASATLSAGANNSVFVGISYLGTSELAGNALGDTVTFGAGGTATLVIEAGATVGPSSIGETNVISTAAGMKIDFVAVNTGSNVFSANAAVVSAPSLAGAENQAVAALGGAGVAYINYGGDEYLVAAHTSESTVSSGDAIVNLIRVNGHAVSISDGVVTLA